MTTLAIYRQDMRGILGTYVDAATWPSEMLDDGIRQALQQFSDEYLAVETSFTVTAAGRQQDLSGITDIREVRGIAWPWTLDYAFREFTNAWRRVGDAVIYIEDEYAYPAVGELIRVRYTKTYKLNGLDSATSTTIPVVWQRAIETGAAGYAGAVRLRQLTENPAVPGGAFTELRGVVEKLLENFSQQLANLYLGSNPAWTSIGL